MYAELKTRPKNLLATRDHFLTRKPEILVCTKMAATLPQSIFNMFLKGIRPMLMVEEDGFIDMIGLLHPGYHLPVSHYCKRMEEKLL